ncbi:MAG: hypothetical protein WAO52_01175 [Prolixibacteraceae bacterium]
MHDESEIPVPIRFNPLKHHRNFILKVLENASPEEIIGLLESVCNNYIDIYTGHLTPESIGKSVIRILKAKRFFQQNVFDEWIDSLTGFRQIELEDGSVWLIRKGLDPERYIHIHPSRSGRFTVRFKGSTLKTAYLLKTNSANIQEKISIERVNQVRKQIGLSPIKKLERNKGIINCFEKFFNE